MSSPTRGSRRLRPVALALLPVVLALLGAAPAARAAPPPGPTAGRSGARPEAGWAWPLDGPTRVLRPFAAPPTPYAPGHRGIDLAARPGEVVLAPVGGVVVFVGTVVDRPLLTIRHGDVLVSMEPVRSSAARGRTVRAGDPIGKVASGGHCRDRCLHLGVRRAGAYVSPLLYLGGIPRAVLLPLE